MAAQGKFEPARKALAEALELAPKHAAVAVELGWVEFRLNQLDSAEKHIEKAMCDIKLVGACDAFLDQQVGQENRYRLDAAVGFLYGRISEARNDHSGALFQYKSICNVKQYELVVEKALARLDPVGQYSSDEESWGCYRNLLGPFFPEITSAIVAKTKLCTSWLPGSNRHRLASTPFLAAVQCDKSLLLRTRLGWFRVTTPHVPSGRISSYSRRMTATTCTPGGPAVLRHDLVWETYDREGENNGDGKETVYIGIGPSGVPIILSKGGCGPRSAFNEWTL